MPPKSILKKTAVSADAPPSARPVNQRHLDLALHHANIIEQRKTVEQQVLDAILVLMDFPTAPNADPTRPSASDALCFCESVIPFQPADYDSLIEERNIADKCGYALCPRPKRKAPSRAKKHFIDTAKGVEIVDRKVLEVWCSDDCAKRALYVKVQLNEEPAWLRQGGYGDKIELMVDNAEEHRKGLPLRLKKGAATPPPPKEEDIAAAWAARDDALADLAIERGETPGRLSKTSKDLIQERIKERVASAPPVPPSPSYGPLLMVIEGHVPLSRSNRNESTTAEKGDDEDEDDRDWDKHLPG
ncbi:hypothetical protein BU26DRAFT_524070 [Trematosphaeria pertusa]|uniref:RNA polymerase II subunit B1 CTD phosphatase RPAP2 homolog n=1 Tax=Trematosphaeria pertusa TaxID=390896 RepID=A0A6A6HZB0_9PLEO|nr:uncharacterized protein BU26DRAFT_524070 [Trematosphaeria pertusa]KAF2243108.1 hypothetical protein BU26DRAFT_524070 [Trematosphaeria pertusa]